MNPERRSHSNYQLALNEIKGDGADETAVNYFKSVAIGSHVEAMRQLGCAYFNGDFGLEVDMEQGLKMFRGAAEGGSAPAQFSLGKAYEGGKLGLVEVSKMYREKIALEIYRNAANGGDEDAQYKLSVAYHMGTSGLDVDQENAFGFVQEATKGGSSRAQDTIKRIEAICTYCDRCKCPEFLCAGHGSDFCEEFTREPQSITIAAGVLI